MPSQGQAPVKSLRCISMRCWAVLIVAASRIRAVTSPSLPPGALSREFGPGAHTPPSCFAINGLPVAEVAGALSSLDSGRHVGRGKAEQPLRSPWEHTSITVRTRNAHSAYPWSANPASGYCAHQRRNHCAKRVRNQEEARLFVKGDRS